MTKDLKHLIYYLYRRRPLAGGPQVCPSKKPVSNSSTLVTSPEPMEKITGVYLDQRLFLEAAKCGLFPFWIKPADTEPPPPLVYKWYLGDVRGQARHPDGGRTVEGPREDRSRLLAASSPTHPGPRRNEGQHGVGPHERAQPHLPIPVLCVRFPGPRSRNGSPRLRSLARQLVGLIPRFCHWSPLILYSHCVDKLHILLHFTADKEQDLMQRHFSTNSDPANNVVGCNNEHGWPQDHRIRLIEYNVDLGGVVFWNSERVCCGTLPPWNRKTRLLAYIVINGAS